MHWYRIGTTFYAHHGRVLLPRLKNVIDLVSRAYDDLISHTCVRLTISNPRLNNVRLTISNPQLNNVRPTISHVRLKT